jgi:predicted DNA-binding protein (MmcQ/YjbR family)
MNRRDVIDFINTEYDTPQEHLWMSYPDYIVFRNSINNKWFAVVMDVERQKLGLKGSGKVDVLNVKCDPILIGSLRLSKGYLPAYHMSKDKWISVLLDGTVADNEIKDLIHLSYELICGNGKKMK